MQVVHCLMECPAKGSLVVKSIPSMVATPGADSLVDKECDASAWKYANHVWCHTLVEAQYSFRSRYMTRDKSSPFDRSKVNNSQSLKRARYLLILRMQSMTPV